MTFLDVQMKQHIISRPTLDLVLEYTQGRSQRKSGGLDLGEGFPLILGAILGFCNRNGFPYIDPGASRPTYNYPM